MNWRHCFAVAGIGSMVWVASACGGSIADSADAGPGTPGTPTMDAGPQTDCACRRGTQCVGTCGSNWTCEDTSRSCSAAPPSSGCGCDGRIVSVAAGCPQRHAYLLGHVKGDLGMACNPERQPPLTYRVEITGSTFHDFNGGTLWVRHSADGEREQTPIQNGTFMYVSASEKSDNEASFVSTLLDRNGNGLCDPSEDLATTLTPLTNEADLLHSVVRYNLTRERMAFPPGRPCDPSN
jgi:hypothetical protein